MRDVYAFEFPRLTSGTTNMKIVSDEMILYTRAAFYASLEHTKGMWFVR